MDVARLGETIKALREQKGYSQRHLAMKAELSNTAISALERGGREGVSMQTVAAIAKGLNISLPELLRAAGEDEAKIRAIPTAIIVELLDLPDKSTFAGLRDYALILTQLDTGLRPGEALGLLPAHVELPSTQLTVPAAKAKTRTSRTLPICQATAEAIGALLGARHPEWGPSVPIFCSADGRQLLVGSWSRRLRRLGEELDYTCRPYDLRHTFALEFLRGGGNVFALQRIMGHADLAMTKRYLALVDADLADQHALASPVARLIPRTHRLRRLSR